MNEYVFVSNKNMKRLTANKQTMPPVLGKQFGDYNGFAFIYILKAI